MHVTLNILAGVKTRYLKGENKLSTKKRHREILTGPRKKDRFGQTEMTYYFKHTMTEISLQIHYDSIHERLSRVRCSQKPPQSNTYIFFLSL